MTTAESEARRALARLRRALIKSDRELDALSRAIRHAEAGDFPEDRYAEAGRSLEALHAFCTEEGDRLIDGGRLGVIERCRFHVRPG